MGVKRLDVTRSFAAGRAARAKGRSVRAIPYDVNSSDLVERVRVRAWIRGWRTGKG